jgi:hypothetical protein
MCVHVCVCMCVCIHVCMCLCVFMHAHIASLHSALVMLRIGDAWRASTMFTGESYTMLMCNTHALRTVRMVVLDGFALPWRITSGLTMPPTTHPPHVNVGVGRCPVQYRTITPIETAYHNIMLVFIIPAGELYTSM